MLRRLLPLALLTPLLALVGTSAAHADPVPGPGAGWPICHHGTDTDGRYCVVSVSRSGPGPVRPAYDTPGTYANPSVSLSGPGDVHLGLDTVVVQGDLSVVEQPGVPSGDSWTYTVNTGSIRPAELVAKAQHASMTLGGDATSGYTATVTFSPTSVSWLAPPTPCTYDGGCGDDTTSADETYAHYVDGVVTDDSAAGLTASQVAARRGSVRATNAQDGYERYVAGTDTLEIRLANPHYTQAGPVATGTYETYLPDAYVTRVLRVPHPAALTGSTLSVVQYSTTTPPPVTYTVSHTTRGVRVRISGFTFPPRARFLVHPAQTAPGAPRWGSVRRTSAHAVRVTFRPPVADGGIPVLLYRARCHGRTGTWHTVKGTTSPISIAGLPRRGVSCKVAARNGEGWGTWSTVRQE